MNNVTSRHTGPVLVGPGGTRSLTRAGHGAGQVKAYDEKFIQQLIHDHPDVIPMADIEPAFTPLVSVCQELETPNGLLDNLWITPAGAVVLGECKLVRNPQARREVVAQALDYARAVSGWSYEVLEQQARKARKDQTFKLWSLVSDGNELDEAQFHDAVQRRLETGRMMVLIVGDGIREGAQALTAFLQIHAGFHAGLALVDLSVWHVGDGSFIVVPSIPMRTVLIERGIVKIERDGAVSIAPPESEPQSGAPGSHTASEAEFYEQLKSRREELVEPLKAFASRLSDVGITPEFGKSLILRWAPAPDVRGSAGYIDSYGTVWLPDSFAVAKRLGSVEVAQRYAETLANAVGGSVRGEWPQAVVGSNGKTVNLVDLLPVRDQWLRALQEFTSSLNESIKDSDEIR